MVCNSLWRRRLLIAIAIGVGGGWVTPAAADETAAWAALRAGGHVALMRHADAPGTGDPPNFKLDDCRTQRNLSERGRDDAKAVGARLRAEKVPVAKLISSPWCRCVDTAKLMALGPEVQIEPTFANAYILSDQRDTLTAGARKLLAPWRGPGTLVVVTHGSNIQALTGTHPGSGEIVVVKPRADGSLTEVGRIAPPSR